MCDYSLNGVTSRPAKVDDKLISTRFSNSSTRGFSAIGEPGVAVCLVPGTEVVFEKAVEYIRPWVVFGRRKLAERVARFRQVDTENPYVHHDALEFPSGKVILVNNLREGQRVTVLQLPANPRDRSDTKEKGHSFLVDEVSSIERVTGPQS